MLEVNPGSETKLSGFTAVSDFKGGEAGFKFQRGWEPGGQVSGFRVSGFTFPSTLSP